jgi:aspartate aminotransferase
MLTHAPHALADRAQAVSESKTTRVFTMAQRLRLEGKDIISLAVGEPDFDTPEEIIQATRQALEAQATRYGPVAGLDELRSELAKSFHGYGPENILVTNGAKQALYTLFQALCNPDDEVILPVPCWVSFTEQIKMAGGRPVMVATLDHQIDPHAIEQAITDRTRAIVINSPNNPTGAVYPKEALVEVAAIAAKHQIYLISDEAYHAFTFDGHSHAGLFNAATARDRVIIVRSFSKHYNMTGFRLGYVAARPSIIQGLTKLQSHICGNVCTFAQHGALTAVRMAQSVVERCRTELEHRRDMAFAFAQSLFDCIKPQGAFYLFPNVTRHLKTKQTSEDLAVHLLTKAGVAVVPGEAFGSPGHIRISFGAKAADLQTAFERIEKAL